MRARSSLAVARYRSASHLAARFLIEGLEHRVLLSSAIAAFGAQQTFATGTKPQSIVIADVNGDGKPDLVVANATSNTVSILLGNGNGTFQAGLTFAIGTKPYSVVVADVNGDGKPDIVTANSTGNDVSVLLGNGNGTFQAQHTFGTGNSPRSVAVADLNRDGKLDIVTANFSGNSVSVLLGNGNGTFQTQTTFATGANPVSVAISDLNQDDELDLAVANFGANNLSTLLGNGDGTFQAQHTFATGASPAALVVADINADGKPDVLVANSAASSSGDSVSLLLGNGNGTLQAQQTFATGSAPSALAVADINADGKPDIITANGTANVEAVLLGAGNGTFQSPKTFATGSGPAAVAVADLNHDGRLDLAVINGSGNTVSVLLGDLPPVVLSINRTTPLGPITSASTLSFTVTFNESVTGVDATDFSLALNGVTATTPVVVTPVSNAVYTVTVNGVSGNGTLGLNLVDNGTIQDSKGNPLQPGGVAGFANQQTFGAGDGPVSTAVADFNGDGKPDVAMADYGFTPGVAVLLGNGDGTFQTGIVPSTQTRNQVSVADVNRDGKMDLLTTGLNGIQIFLGNGNGTFQSPQTISFGVYSQTTFVAAADLNNDGKPDLIVGDPGTDDVIRILLGNGNGTFGPQQTYYAGFQPSDIAIADVNGDGKLDLVAADTGSGAVDVLLGNGDGTFQVQPQIYDQGARSIAIGDLNGDGKPDLVTDNTIDRNGYFTSFAAVLLGNGNGTFKAAKTLDIGTNPEQVALGDVNGDGKLDIVTSNPSDQQNVATILLGNGDGTFQAPQTFAVGPDPVSVTIADFNNDGKADLIVGNEAGNSASVLLGNVDGRFAGQLYTVIPYSGTINGNPYQDQVTLIQDTDHVHIDWILNGSYGGQVSITDPGGITVNGNGSLDSINLDYTNGNPLPNKLSLNGTFWLNNLPVSGNPLANTTIDLKTSSVFINYRSPANDPMNLLRNSLMNGFNGGTWTGTATATTGAIQSSSAALDPDNFAIGYADSADPGNPTGLGLNLLELRYAAIGDTNLNNTVDINDYNAVVRNFGTGTLWDQGDVTYDPTVSIDDYNAIVRHFGNVVSSPAALPAESAAFSAATVGVDSNDPKAARPPGKLKHAKAGLLRLMRLKEPIR